MKSVLLVEDDPAIRLVLLRIFGRHGWQVDAVESVEEALAFLYRKPPSVVLTDWHLGSDTGLRLLIAIKMHPTWNAVPVLMMSGGATPADVVRAFENGADDFLAEPFSGEEILGKLDCWVSGPGHSTELERVV